MSDEKSLEEHFAAAEREASKTLIDPKLVAVAVEVSQTLPPVGLGLPVGITPVHTETITARPIPELSNIPTPAQPAEPGRIIEFEGELAAIREAVIKLQNEPSIPDQTIVNSKLAQVFNRIEALETFQGKVIAAFKHLGLDVNKHLK